MAACGCLATPNPLSRGCTQKARSKNIGTLIREGYGPAQATAIAYATQRQSGCKIPRRRAKKNARRESAYERYMRDLREIETEFARSIRTEWSPEERRYVTPDAAAKDRARRLHRAKSDAAYAAYSASGRDSASGRESREGTVDAVRALLGLAPLYERVSATESEGLESVPEELIMSRHSRRRAGYRTNSPYGVYGVSEQFDARFDDIGAAAEYAKRALYDHHRSPVDKMVVYDEERMDRGPKGEFVAMFRPNKKRRRKAKSKRFRKNPTSIVLPLTIGALAIAGLVWFLKRSDKKV